MPTDQWEQSIPLNFFLKDTIHICICSFTDLSLLLFARVYSVTVFIMAFANCNSLEILLQCA